MQPREPRVWCMRMDGYEDARIQGRIGAAATFGSRPRLGWLPATNRRQVPGGSSQFRFPLDESLSSWRRWGIGGTRSQRTPAETYPPARASSAGMVPAFAHEFRLSHRIVDRHTDGADNLSQVADQVSSALSRANGLPSGGLRRRSHVSAPVSKTKTKCSDGCARTGRG